MTYSFNEVREMVKKHFSQSRPEGIEYITQWLGDNNGVGLLEVHCYKGE